MKSSTKLGVDHVEGEGLDGLGELGLAQHVLEAQAHVVPQQGVQVGPGPGCDARQVAHLKKRSYVMLIL